MSTFLSEILEQDSESIEEQIKHAILCEALPQLINRVTTYLSIENNQKILKAEIQKHANKFTELFAQSDNYQFVIGGTSAPLARLILKAISFHIIGNDYLISQMLTPLVLNQSDNKSAYNSFSDPLAKYKFKNNLIFYEEVILSGKKLKGFLSKYPEHRFYSFISSIDFKKEVYSVKDLDVLKLISSDPIFLNQEQKERIETFNTSLENNDLFSLIRRLSLLSNLYYGVFIPMFSSKLNNGRDSLNTNQQTPSFFSQALDKYIIVSPENISDDVKKNLVKEGEIINMFQSIIE